MTRKPAATRTRARPDQFTRVTRAASHLPGVEVSVSYGTPALKVKGKLMARLWEDGETLVLYSWRFSAPKRLLQQLG